MVSDMTIKPHDQTEKLFESSPDRMTTLKLALKSAKMGVWQYNIAERKRIYDNQVCFLLGIDPATFKGTEKEFWARVHPEDLVNLKTRLANMITGGKEYETEFRTIWPDGSTHYIATRGELIRDDKGQPLMVRGIIWEITERKLEQEALKASEEKYHKLHDVMIDGFGIVDMNGKFLEVNNSLCNMLGVSLKEMLTLGYPDITPKEWHSLDTKIISTQVLRRGYSDCYEKEYIRKDGAIFPVELRIYLMRDPKGQPAGMWAIVKDVTERKRNEKIMQDQRKLLEESERNIKKFSQRMLSIREEEKKELSVNLHDETGAMAVVFNAGLSVIQSELEEGNYKKALKVIRNTKVVFKKEIANFRRIIKALRPPNLEIVGLSGVLKEKLFKKARESGLDIRLKDEMGNIKLSDQIAISLYRITQEALTNIIKYAKAKKIVVHLCCKGDKIEFSICDDGKGFDINHVFKDLKVLKLGIHGMRERVETLGGTFIINSVIKKGTTIKITVPISGGGKI